MPNILDKIVETKKLEVANAKDEISFSQLKDKTSNFSIRRGFVNSISQKIMDSKIALIAEVKKASPSKGLIREEFDPENLAIQYEKAGATCLSVLTDEQYFKGHSDFLKKARDAVSLPVLRKDFIIDDYQIYQSLYMGADCILLIMAILTDDEAKNFVKIANNIGLDTLVEVHDEEELRRALMLDVNLIGINNRNLKTFETSLEVSERLVKLITGNDKIIVSESGIFTNDEVMRLQNSSINCFLVGESLMRNDDVFQATIELLGA